MDKNEIQSQNSIWEYTSLPRAEAEALVKGLGWCGISFRLSEPSRIHVRQEGTSWGILLNRKLLYQKARKIFDSPEVVISSGVSQIDFDHTVTPEWLNEQMKSLGLNTKDLARQTGIPSADIAAYFNGQSTKLSTRDKGLIYFCLLAHDLSQHTLYLRGLLSAQDAEVIAQAKAIKAQEEKYI